MRSWVSLGLAADGLGVSHPLSLLRSHSDAQPVSKHSGRLAQRNVAPVDARLGPRDLLSGRLLALSAAALT